LAWKQIALGVALLAILCFPVLPYYRSAAGSASTFSFAASPDLTNVLGVLRRRWRPERLVATVVPIAVRLDV
jgi:hypothetical protein